MKTDGKNVLDGSHSVDVGGKYTFRVSCWYNLRKNRRKGYYSYATTQIGNVLRDGFENVWKHYSEILFRGKLKSVITYPFSMKKRPNSEMLNAFYGRDDIPELVVLTPIPQIYERFRGILYSLERKRWWPNFKAGVRNGKEIMVINTNQGSSIVDSVLSLQDCCGYLLFLGYCGGLHPDMKRGDLTFANESYFEASYFPHDNNVYRPKADLSVVQSCFPSAIPGPNVTVKSVVKEMEAIEEGRLDFIEPGTASVDMETGFLYQESKIPSVSVMLVTDLPKSDRRTLFNEWENHEYEHFAEGERLLVRGTLELIDKLYEQDFLG